MRRLHIDVKSEMSYMYDHEDSNLSENDVALGRLPAPRKLLFVAWSDIRRICYLHVRCAIAQTLAYVRNAVFHIVCTNASYTH